MDYQVDKWFSAVPVGWPAVLTAGAALGVPWLVNPMLAGVNVLLVYLLLSELYSMRIARISVLLLCFSPWHIFLAMSFMTHTVTMTCALLAFLGVVRARRSGSTGWALLAGAAIGAGSLVRPLDGLIVALLTAAWALGIGGTRLKLRGLVALAAGTLLVGALALPYNKALTGDSTVSPLMSYTDKQYGSKANAYGFGPDRGLGWPTDAYPGHTPFEALINAQLNGASLNTELFGWGTGSLILIGAMLFWGTLRRPDYLMLASIGVVLLAYAPYWGNGGADFGARYWYLILVPCVVLSARGLESLEALSGVRATAAVALLCGLALFNYFPWRSLDKYHHYLRMRPDIRTLSRGRGFGRSLVFVRGERFPDYASAAIYNPLDLTSNVPIFVWDHDPAVRAKILCTYPDRPTWIVEGPSITHAGYRIVAGPLPAGSQM
jgi:4-amino-4-deoxy-L-arabinose transferase-like glycosyltransferase